MNRDATRPAVPAHPHQRTSDPGLRTSDPGLRTPEPGRWVPDPDPRAPDPGRPPAQRPTVEELRLTSFKSYRRASLPLAPLTVLHGPAGVGKSNALDALAVLSRLALGEEITDSLDGLPGRPGPLAAPVRGGLAGCVPHGRNALILGCTVRSADGPIGLEVVVRTDGPVRIAREQLTLDGRTLVETGEQDLRHQRINVSWHNDTRQGDIRAPFPNTALITAQLPLRVAGSSAGERTVLAAAEQLLTALREVFPVHPVPALMRGWARPDPQARLLSTAANISAVIARLSNECSRRYGQLLRVVQSAAPHPLLGLDLARRGIGTGERVLAVFDEGVLGRTGADQASDGMLRHLAFAAVLLTGAGVLDLDPAAEVPWAHRQLTVLAGDLGAGLGTEQTASLLRLARDMAGRNQLRVLAALQEPAAAREALGGDGELPPGVALVECRRDPGSGHTVLRAETARVPAQGGARGAGADGVGGAVTSPVTGPVAGGAPGAVGASGDAVDLEG
ncbi:ATP-binding protein [Kitasatospora sp. NPDC047058]|uniref:AAA family ATPase n=1 Tax=Kitasatospora sp. NPDC047058 TaxID=3155620 RepID=UPI0033E77FA0